MMSDGLAFSEEKEMKKLSQLAEKGWLLDSFAFLGYSLRKGQPEKIIYNLDYCSVDGDELEEYRAIFKASGWNLVCSSGNMHIFSAKSGTRPIHTERGTEIEKYEKAKGVLGKVSFTFVFFTFLIASVRELLFINGTNEVIIEGLFYLFAFLLVISIPTVMTYGAYKYKIYKLKYACEKYKRD